MVHANIIFYTSQYTHLCVAAPNQKIPVTVNGNLVETSSGVSLAMNKALKHVTS